MDYPETRIYDIGDTVITKGGTVAKVIGSALNPYLGNCYRLKKNPDSKRTFYRREHEIKGLREVKE